MAKATSSGASRTVSKTVSRPATRTKAAPGKTARKPETLGVKEPPLTPLVRAGVVVRESDGRVWVDRAKARRRQLRIASTFALLGLLIALAAWAAMRM